MSAARGSLEGRARRRGFTLIEVMGAFFVTTVVLLFVTGIFQENGRQRAVATERLRVETTAHGALDRLAQDLEATLYVSRPPDRDARDHPWVFRAEGPGELGATRLRFATQNVARGQLAENTATWIEVAWFLTEEEPDPDERGFTAGPRYTLWRWRSVRPPSVASERFPDADDPGAARVAEGLADFGVRFVDADGGVVDEWDSAFALDEAPLPLTAEIRLSLYEDAREGEAEPGILQLPGRVRERAVSLAMPAPLDVKALVALALESAGELQCATIADCADIEDEWFVELRQSGCGGDEDLCALLDRSNELCWSEFAGEYPSVASSAPAACEEL